MSTLNRRLLALFLPAAFVLRPAPAAAQAPPLPRQPGNLMAPGAQGLAAVAAARGVPFQPQTLSFAVGPQMPLSALQQRLIAVRRIQSLNLWQQRQLVALMGEELELSVLQQQLTLWGQQPLNPADQQQLAALETLLAALQQQNLLRQLAVMQP